MSANGEYAALEQRERDVEAKIDALKEEGVIKLGTAEKFQHLRAMKVDDVKRQLESFKTSMSKIRVDLRAKMENSIDFYNKFLPCAEEMELITNRRRELQCAPETRGHDSIAADTKYLATLQLRQRQEQPSRRRSAVELLQQSGREQRKPPSQTFPGLGVAGHSVQRSAERRSGDQPLTASTAVVDPIKRPGSLGRKSMLRKGKMAVVVAPQKTEVAATPEKALLKLAPKPTGRAEMVIELLESDEEDEEEARDFEAPRQSGSRRPTRSSVKQSIMQRIGQISATYPQESRVGPDGERDGVDVAAPEAGITAGESAWAEVQAAGAAVVGFAGKALDTVVVTSRDLLTLEDGEFLNDSVIDFFVKKLRNDDMEPEDAARCHIFNSFFFEKLVNVSQSESSVAGEVRQKCAHERVERWTRNVNIFEKDYVFFPIHSHLHWSLVILCHPGEIGKVENLKEDSIILDKKPAPYLLHLDSMAGGHKTSYVVTRLREYLAMEYHRQCGQSTRAGEVEKNGKLLQFSSDSLPHLRMKIPQQDNGCDCGLFLLSCMHFVNPKMPAQLSSTEILSAYRNDTPPHGSSLPTGFLRRDWFVTAEAPRMRARITVLILEQLLNSVQHPEGKGRIQCESIERVIDEVRVQLDERNREVLQAEKAAEKSKARQRRRIDRQDRDHEVEKIVASTSDGADAASAGLFYGSVAKEAAGVVMENIFVDVERKDATQETDEDVIRLTEDEPTLQEGNGEAQLREQVRETDSEDEGRVQQIGIDETTVADTPETDVEDSSEEDSENEDVDYIPSCLHGPPPLLTSAARGVQRAEKQLAAAIALGQEATRAAGKATHAAGMAMRAAGKAALAAEVATEAAFASKRKRVEQMTGTTHRKLARDAQIIIDDVNTNATGNNVRGSALDTTATARAPDICDLATRKKRVASIGWINVLSG